MMSFIWGSLKLFAALLFVTLIGLIIIRRRFKNNRSNLSSQKIIGFFHPYCNDGGGGERVLWCCVKALQENHKDLQICIYTGAEPTLEQDPKMSAGEKIVKKAQERFSIEVNSDRVKFIFLQKRWLVEAKTWPRFTLLGQSIGSILLGWEALSQLTPDIYFDTMGYAFTYPLFRLLGGCEIAAYVHYPTISTDMIQLVSSATAQYNNSDQISKSPLKTQIKLRYYRLFAALYGFVGSFSKIVMTNSSWTKGHIQAIWKTPLNRLNLLYPPCNTAKLQEIPLNTSKREKIIVSIAQFRPEKNHPLQVEAFSLFLNSNPEYQGKVRLVMIGSVRNGNLDDNRRVEDLKNMIAAKGLEKDIQLVVNCPFDELRSWYSRAMIGLHTMWNEHFGIGVVELLAAGVIPVAHNSAGPKEDIVVPYDGQTTGFLASIAQEYAHHFQHILNLNDEQRLRIQTAGRLSAQRFSDELFQTRFLTFFREIL